MAVSYPHDIHRYTCASTGDASVNVAETFAGQQDVVLNQRQLSNDEKEINTPEKLREYNKLVAKLDMLLRRASRAQKVNVVDYVIECPINCHNVVVQRGLGTTIYLNNCTMPCLQRIAEILTTPA